MTSEQTFQLAQQHHRAGRFVDADRMYRQILAENPNHAGALNMLGIIGVQAGHEQAGVQLLTRAAAIRPELVSTLFELGNGRSEEGKFDQAIWTLSQAAAVCPNSAEAHFHLGNAFWRARRYPEAIDSLTRAVALGPQSAAAYNSLGVVLTAQDRLDDAIRAFKRAVELDPNLYQTYINYGNALSSVGLPAEALETFRAATRISDDPRGWDNVLLTVNYVPGVSVQRICDEHAQWARRTQKLIPTPQFSNDRTVDRRLRIGYVSPDFNAHPVVRFMLPLLRNHDRSAVEIFCYSNGAVVDEQTATIRALAHAWRDIRPMNDVQAADIIRQDRIDILMDLCLHGEGNRLGVFALKPAPVQATWLGYVGTTGLRAMDYRLSDPHLDEPGNDPDFVERTIRLPRTFWCYERPTSVALDRPTPAASNGYPTFGSFNSFVKVNGDVVRAWARILAGSPGSRIILHSRPGSHRDRALAVFAAAGVDSSRVEFFGFLPTNQYMDNHLRIDIALDPFPFGGGTTSCDALWMGVPLITLKGATGPGRAGTSLLQNLGLPELIANSVDEYVSLAVRLGNDLPRLQQLHRDLQNRMRHSALIDGPAFARDMESVQREMWRRWCAVS